MSQTIKVTENGAVEFTASQVKAIRRQQSLIRIAEKQLGYTKENGVSDRIERLLSQCSPNGESTDKEPEQ